MTQKKLTALFLVIVMIFTMVSLPALALTENATVSWKGAMNYNDANNYVTLTASMPAYNRAEMKWAYPLNTSVISGGAYYAGQSVIANGYLYATGGGKLHKVDIKTGTGSIINDNAGTTISYYDYLCYADGILILSTQDSIIAYNLDGEALGSVSGSYGEYHPIQYYDGYVICNGFIYKVDKENESVTFTQTGDTAIGGDTFNWNSGAFVDDLFYVASRTTIYAVDYTTNTVVDSYIFDANRTATKNVQGGLCYDADTGRLFWATYTYNSYIHSIAVMDNHFVENSYLYEDAGQKSVATPIVYNGRVYLAGQQGRICVHNANNLSKIYDAVTLGGGKVQGTPILSAFDEQIRIYAQCSNGHLYMFTDNGDSGKATMLAETKNYTKVNYPYAGFEQYAMDEDGNIYCYNESGYLFCFGISSCEKPTIITDLSTDRVKYGVDEKTDALTVEATVSEGELSYQWQLSSDGDDFTDINGATEASYAPSSNAVGTTYYRVIITNTVGTDKASETSSVAHVLVKNLSNNTSLNAMVGKSNSATATSNVAVAADEEDGVLYVENCDFDVKNIFLGVANEGFVSSIEIICGSGTTAPKKYSVNHDTYRERYYINGFIKPIVAKISIVAEDGISEDEKYLIVSEQSANKYITKAAIAAESEYFADNTINFTEAEQTAALTVIPQKTIGKGEVYNPKWEWSSSDKKVAIVDSNGVVRSVGGGDAVITASYQGVTASVNITSSAAEHTLHTYLAGECLSCGQKEPSEIDVKFTMIDKDGNVALSRDNITQMYKAEISVGDCDCDGVLTLNDAFIKVHTQHSLNGSADFKTEASSYGPFITKLWGEQTSDVAYMLNDANVYSLLTALNQNDTITAYFYRDTESYSDVYTYIQGNTTIVAGSKTEFLLKGIASSGEVFAKGTTIKIFDKEGLKISETTVGDDGEFEVVVDNAGEYTLEASGYASYFGKVWDSILNDYCDKEFKSAPIVTSRFSVTVLPYVEKTVYVTIATKNGEFAIDKNGNDMWRVPITAVDNPDAPDGVITISEILVAAHEQHHSSKAAALKIEESQYGAFITKLWDENNGGNCLYYFNDVEMTGAGVKAGTNGREWEDKLLNTVVESNDSFTIYSLQATDYTKSDLYTYFSTASESASVGEEKTFTLKSVAGYGNNKVETSIVTVRKSDGTEIKDLATMVDKNGTFKITFTQEGNYTVDVRTNGANYISPARCSVTVKEKDNGGGGDSSSSDTISVYFTLLGDKKHGTPVGAGDTHTKKKGNLDTWISKTKITLDKGSCVIDAIEKALILNGVSYTKEDNYISEVKGLAEFDNGSVSGWMYMLNGKYPTNGIDEQKLSDGDTIIFHYTDDYTTEKTTYLGGTSSSVSAKPKDDKTDKTPETEKKPLFTENTYKDISLDDWHYEGVKYVYENNLMQGTGSGFEPNSKMTRAMLITVLWRLENEPAANFIMDFNDVVAGEWYTEAVSWATSENIISGIGNNLLGTNDEVTREQMATILYRYIQKKNVKTEFKTTTGVKDYTDSGAISEYAVSAIEWAVNAGIIKGKTQSTISPADSATRAEVAVMLMRFCEGISK